MSDLLLAIVAVIYLGVAVSYLLERNHGMALAFVAYAVANIGFIIAARP
jgi:hypothetical protein